MTTFAAEIVREYGPYPGVERVGGVSYDGRHVWLATGDRLVAVSEESGEFARAISVPAHAGTAFDGTHLYQIAERVIRKIEPDTGRVVSTIPAPGESNSGLAWAEGSLWVGQYRDRTIVQVDPDSGKVLRTIPSNRFVTGVTWVDNELWHATWEDEQSEIRHINADTGAVIETLEMPKGVSVAGLESDGTGGFFCGGGTASGTVRRVRRKA